jgi:hypothetical protein
LNLTKDIKNITETDINKTAISSLVNTSSKTSNLGGVTIPAESNKELPLVQPKQING